MGCKLTKTRLTTGLHLNILKKSNVSIPHWCSKTIHFLSRNARRRRKIFTLPEPKSAETNAFLKHFLTILNEKSSKFSACGGLFIRKLFLFCVFPVFFSKKDLGPKKDLDLKSPTNEARCDAERKQSLLCPYYRNIF